MVEADTDAAVYKDISYAYSGYAPLSLRIMQQLSRPGGANDDVSGSEDPRSERGKRNRSRSEKLGGGG